MGLSFQTPFHSARAPLTHVYVYNLVFDLEKFIDLISNIGSSPCGSTAHCRAEPYRYSRRPSFRPVPPSRYNSQRTAVSLLMIYFCYPSLDIIMDILLAK